jgi:transcriptional regulator with XRE-family HTH domain
MTDIPSTEAIFGETVRLLRQERGLSQDDLAAAMRAEGFDWHQTTTSKTEAAQRPIRLNEAKALADILRMRLSAMLRGIDADYLDLQKRLEAAQLAKARADQDIQRLEVESFFWTLGEVEPDEEADDGEH